LSVKETRFLPLEVRVLRQRVDDIASTASRLTRSATLLFAYATSLLFCFRFLLVRRRTVTEMLYVVSVTVIGPNTTDIGGLHLGWKVAAKGS
jgi:hypothetical protein